jgi:hypothetical protein
MIAKMVYLWDKRNDYLVMFLAIFASARQSRTKLIHILLEEPGVEFPFCST